MKRLTFLVLTDHSGHSDQNSLYALINTLVEDPRAARVDVASRGDEVNRPFFQGDGARVQGFSVKAGLHYSPEGYAFRGTLRELDPADYDVVWLRLPHPVSDRFFDHLVHRLADCAPIVVNDPAGIRATSTKSFLTNFPDWTPPTRLVHSPVEVADFAAEHPIVLKPLRAYGGQGIVRVDQPRQEVEHLFTNGVTTYLAMKFLRNVSEGDKRILVVNGRILAASLRIPPPGEWLCNVAQGGRSVAAEVTPREEAMVEALKPHLLDHGICFAGVDTLVDDDGQRVLSEINTLSIGGFPQAESQTRRPILQQAIDELFSYCYERC
ncbi:glutathione synthase [Lewinella marina]|uniref:Glutathione synthetase n=1 Tax=Neolewinella marina TaxID=438751 RepID=A0A2G0CH92_9BACT|nr:glutathione synthetase [Neolewinella marina]NJB86179.1 glutathione synthase [Neolewinella marina]PHK99344.1 glutathione synthetase [Neolewinella marina]